MPNFNDYSISSYGGMVIDERRTRPYVDALKRTVHPGATVLDIGTGTGLFAFVAAQLGAARVYAVEPDDAIDVARQCAADNVNGERIQWIQGLSTEIELPERVDVVIGDLHGTLPFFKNNIESMKDARLRHLKPGGWMFPRRDLLFIVPCRAPQEYQTLREPWEANDYGVDFSAARRWIANSWWKVRGDAIDPADLLAAPAMWGVVDYLTAESANLRGSAEWTVEQASPMHGYYAWFETELDQGVAISNTPLLPSIAYGRAFFPLEGELALEPGDHVRVQLSVATVAGAHIYSWVTHVTASDGSKKAHFRQTTFNNRPLAPRLRQASEHHVAELGDAGRVKLAILQGMADARALGEIAETLAARFPEQFASKAAALRQVTRVTAAHTRMAHPGIRRIDPPNSDA